MGLRKPRIGDPKRVLEVTLGCAPGEVAEDVVVTPFLPLKAFARHADEGTVRELSPPFFYKGLTAAFGGHPVTVILTGVGPARVGDCVSILSLTPARRVLFAGAVGGLGGRLAIGDFFLPVEAADGEGYTRYTLRPFGEVAAGAPRIRCDGGLEEALKRYLDGRGVEPTEGRVFTIGSIAFESPANLRALAASGYDALEMELSAFYAAAGRHGLLAAALAYVSDLPLGSSLWQEKTAEEEARLQTAYRLLPELCLGFFRAEG